MEFETENPSSDSNHSVPLDSNHSVNVPEPIFVKLEIENVQSLNLQIKRCWATPKYVTTFIKH